MGEKQDYASELARLEKGYMQSLADAYAMDLDAVARIALILEIEAKYLGALESCRAALQRTSRSQGGRDN